MAANVSRNLCVNRRVWLTPGELGCFKLIIFDKHCILSQNSLAFVSMDPDNNRSVLIGLEHRAGLKFVYIMWVSWFTVAMLTRPKHTVYPKKYAHGFVVLCFVVVMQSFIINSHEVFIHIHLGCFAGTGAIVRLPQCQWSKPDGYGKISQCITTTKHSEAKTVCIFLGIYCMLCWWLVTDTD